MKIGNNLEQLVMARRLMVQSQRIEDRRNGKQVEETSLQEDMEEDRAIISGKSPDEVERPQTAPPTPPAQNVKIRLADLFAHLESERAKVEAAGGRTQISIETVVERDVSFTYRVLEPVDGLVRRSQNLAETDRYLLEFQDGKTFKITDKWSGRSTTIWGDPHIDVDDVQGNLDGDFQDLKGSNMHTTMMLQDGTRVTFTALDSGVIEAVDIFKGSQHLGGIGAASKQWSEKDGLFASPVDESGKSSSAPTGDTVYAGGDGNDWFTSGGQLLWGQTTGAAVNTRPYAVMQLEYHERITQQVSMQFVNKKI